MVAPVYVWVPPGKESKLAAGGNPYLLGFGWEGKGPCDGTRGARRRCTLSRVFEVVHTHGLSESVTAAAIRPRGPGVDLKQLFCFRAKMFS